MKTVQVKFIKSHPQFAHDPGDVCELLEIDAFKLIDSGYAVLTKNIPAETATVPASTENAAITLKSKRK